VKKIFITLQIIFISLFFDSSALADWYNYFHNPNTITPIQTSYSSPLNVTASCDYGALDAYGWKVFTQSSNDIWGCVYPESDPSLMIDLGTASSITSYSISTDSSYKDSMPSSWVVYGSNDSSCALDGNWTEVDSQSGQTSWRAQEMRIYTLAAPSAAYKCWKIILPNTGIVAMSEWELSNYVAPASAPAKSMQYLVVGGGGAGSGDSSFANGGGGGGGVLQGTIDVSPQTTLVYVGRGGRSYYSTSVNSENSTFISLVASGGGSGGADGYNGNNGGSGGGGGGQESTAGAGTEGQGYAGGNGSVYAGGGGGGAGHAGYAGSDLAGGGNGGDGVSSSISGTEQYYGGGGAGFGGEFEIVSGTGGLGGGGDKTTNQAGTPNTGGGSGGEDGTSCIGGSGIVILRWKTSDFGTCSVTGTGNTITTAPDDATYSLATFLSSGYFVVSGSVPTTIQYVPWVH